jgi:hypothetical protein
MRVSEFMIIVAAPVYVGILHYGLLAKIRPQQETSGTTNPGLTLRIPANAALYAA